MAAADISSAVGWCSGTDNAQASFASAKALVMLSDHFKVPLPAVELALACNTKQISAEKVEHAQDILQRATHGMKWA